MEDRYAPPSIEFVSSRFEEFGFPLFIDDNIIPNDDTTLFVCSGMQNLKQKFLTPNGTKYGSLQSCVRTNDLELVGDGSHLTFFQMLGNFHFGGDYEVSVELWHSILRDCSIPVDSVHCHPDNQTHKKLWISRGYQVQDDSECVWSDGNVGGNCCEIYSRGLEIGNLVNTLGHSVDVGFGWERLIQITENVSRVDQTSLFGNYHPIISDHSRTLEVFWRHNIMPGNKGRNYICRRLVRRMMPLLNTEKFIFQDWIESEKEQLNKRLREAKRIWRRYQDKSPEWWWTTCGILPEEIELIRV